MVDIARVAAVPQRLHNPIDDTDLRLQLPQKKDPSITRRRAAVEVCFHFFPRNPCKCQHRLLTFIHGSFLSNGGLFSVTLT